MRKILTVVAAVGLVLTLADPAWATMVTREKYASQGSDNCGNANSMWTWSWVKADLPTGPTMDVSYNGNGPGATYDDLRIDVANPNGVVRIDAEILKLQADGTGPYQTHYLDRSYYDHNADSVETVEFAGSGDITKSRHPYLNVKVVWNDGACHTQTAWDNDWLP